MFERIYKMKNLILVLCLILVFTGCAEKMKKQPPFAITAQITDKMIYNEEWPLHVFLDYDMNIQNGFISEKMSDILAVQTVQFTGLQNGSYYLYAYKDMDRSYTLTSRDVVMWYKPVSVNDDDVFFSGNMEVLQ